MEIFDLLIIGGGPGGYLCAERTAQDGMKVALFEKRSIGGVCLNEGCIPTKTLLNSAKLYRHAVESESFGVTAENVVYDHARVIKRKGGVVKTLVGGVTATLAAHKVQVIKESAKIQGKTEEGFAVATESGEIFVGKRLCIATGSDAVVPPIPGLKEGLDNGFVMTNREILDDTKLPENFVCIGGGVIGLEMACYFASVGVKVTVIEMMDKIAGSTDADICKVLMKEYKKRGMEFLLSARVLEVTKDAVIYEQNGEKKSAPCDKVLLSAGRRPTTADIGLEAIGVETERGAIVTDRHMCTNVANVYAVGDCNGKVMLAHTAYREAEVAANHMNGKRDEMRYDNIPSVIYTDPEVASVGISAAVAAEKDIKAKEVVMSMMYSGRYVAETDNGPGFCKIVVDSATNRLLGIHIVGSYASEMILTAEMMLDTELPIEQLKKIIFPHPTVCEVIRETIFKI